MVYLFIYGDGLEMGCDEEGLINWVCMWLRVKRSLQYEGLIYLFLILFSLIGIFSFHHMKEDWLAVQNIVTLEWKRLESFEGRDYFTNDHFLIFGLILTLYKL